MKVVMQNFKTGELSVSDTPPPVLKPNGILVRNAYSLVSAGTEKAVIELAKMNPLDKAKARPDLVKKVLNKIGQEGIFGTAQAVLNLLNQPLPLGYSCAGIVEAVGQNVSDIKCGDRVACAGLGFANHAEVVYVPRNLSVVIPKNVCFEDAAFVTVGAIAMQGIRQAELRVGENVVVLGLGLVGQLAAQIAAASGCRVFGIDLDKEKVKLAKSFGASGSVLGSDSLAEQVKDFTRGQGADAIIITAATASSQPVELAAELARDRGRVVAVGDVGLQIPRRPYYEKELDLRLSRSYGPGRYDPAYEEQGRDYPLGYVRWTENRNMEAFLDLIFAGKVQVKKLVSHQFTIEDAEQAYDLLTGKSKEPYIAILLRYDLQRQQPTSITLDRPSSRREAGVRLGIIGAGQFARAVLLPKIRRIENVSLEAVATGSGLTSTTVGKKYGCRFTTSDYAELLRLSEINSVLIATRHDLHAKIVMEALRAGKHTFVEKPLAVNVDELREVITTYKGIQKNSKDVPVLMTGYNRRFSPLTTALKAEFSAGQLIMNYRVNAGSIDSGHWTQDSKEGGGRIVGEICHFIDVMQYLTASLPVRVQAMGLVSQAGDIADSDNVSIQITFSDGSIGAINYVANGDPSFPKERLEVFGGGKAAVIENWRGLEIYKGGRKISKRSLLTSQKGHKQELCAFVDGVLSGEFPISFESQIWTSAATFAVQEALRKGKAIEIDLGPDLDLAGLKGEQEND